MTIRAEEMKRLTNYWIELKKLRNKILDHAKTFTKSEMTRSTSQLHVDEFSFLFSANINDFQDLFTELGYEAHVEKYDEVQEGYFGEVRLYW